MEALYGKLESKEPFSPDAKSEGRRALRNVALRYLTAADDEAAAALADTHYRSAANMTDMVAGLAALSRNESEKRKAAFIHFHDSFPNNPLVLDKWLSLQAGSPLPGTLDRVRRAARQDRYQKSQPRRSLAGAFAANHLRFHARDGGGYAFIGETVRMLDGINPQVAARMAGAFENWRRYDEARQALMRAQLQTIADTKGLSANLFEVATKMLG